MSLTGIKSSITHAIYLKQLISQLEEVQKPYGLPINTGSIIVEFQLARLTTMLIGINDTLHGYCTDSPT